MSLIILHFDTTIIWVVVFVISSDIITNTFSCTHTNIALNHWSLTFQHNTRSTMAAAQEYKPGFMHLRLATLDTRSPDRKGMESRVKSLRQQLTTRNPGIQTALHNLLGISLYGLGRYKEAHEQFLAVIEENQHNLNGLEHCSKVLEKLGQKEDAQKYKQRLKDVEWSEERTGMMLLEQAYACTFEVYHKVGKDRYLNAIKLYRQGFKLHKNLTKAEKVEWMICHGCAYHKLLDIFLQYGERDDKLVKESYSDALKVFHEACEEAVGLESEAMCWSYLGQILCKPPRKHQNVDQEFLAANSLTEYFKKPDLCFEKALESKPHDKEASCRYARHLLRHPTAERLNKAHTLLNDVIDAREADLNWFVYALRAEVLLAKYERNKTAENKANLNQAKQDYEKVENPNAKNNQNIEKIRRYLAE